ncbi:hypothetical protein HQ584_00970 [Patescibacteria group bacterium]|nr:hypothetical protein [Patescibacteria group bacterium]
MGRNEWWFECMRCGNLHQGKDRIQYACPKCGNPSANFVRKADAEAPIPLDWFVCPLEDCEVRRK